MIKIGTLNYGIGAVFFIGIILVACNKILPQAPPADTVMNAPIDGLSPEESKFFAQGAQEFDEVYTAQTGLGPIYVASSCAGCHSGDNKGHPFTTLTRFGQADTFGNTFMHLGGPQLQQNFMPGYLPETLPLNATSTKLVAPIVAGMGLLEAIPEATLLALADPTDANQDGISGRVNFNAIPDWVKPANGAYTYQKKYLCRFGKKASTYNIAQQTIQAFQQDMGITSQYLPQNPINLANGSQSLPISQPDITDPAVQGTIFYIQALQAPLPRNTSNANVLKGASIFNTLQCNACHVPSMQTGFSYINALANKTIYPYTDLLLHDMGPALNDNYTEGTALPAEWRTPPLWGLGLSASAQGGKYFLLHDGRATSIEQAILWHGGEANASKVNYEKLSAEDKQNVLLFLESL